MKFSFVVEFNAQVFLKIFFSGRIRNIYFPFDVETDTALSVATEMVAELDITDQDVTKIADMIDGEIASLVPEWRPGPGIEETPRFANQGFCHNCASNRTSTGSLMEYFSNPYGTNLQLLQCCRNGCASMHGRFGEITFDVDESEHHVTDGAPNESSQSDCLHYQEIWGQLESRELSSVDSGHSHSDEEYEKLDQSFVTEDNKETKVESETALNARNSTRHLVNSHSYSEVPSVDCDQSDNHEKEIQQELRWLKAKYMMELSELREQQLGVASKTSSYSNKENNTTNGRLSYPISSPTQRDRNGFHLNLPTDKKHFSSNCSDRINKSCPSLDPPMARYCGAIKESLRTEDTVTATRFPSGSLLPPSLHRTTSLPADAIDL